MTTIVMPHRGPHASLRPARNAAAEGIAKSKTSTVSKFSSMSAIQILKFGLAEGLWKRKGWLYQLLQREGIADGSKQQQKEVCWQYYKSQMLYIEVIQDAKDDTTFDPRSNKGTVKPKNALTVTYLCFAFDVPYATFKRWKIDARVTSKVVPVNKGKSVLTDKNWASKIYNVRRMFIMRAMAVWLNKHPAKKYDTAAKKVILLKER
jgi:hypothetical protein